MNSISLYLHIPFCAKKCRYCDFYSVSFDERLAWRYLDGLAAEIALCKKSRITEGAAVQTIFIGGGTPSVFSGEALHSLCTLVRSSFTIAPGYEWTVECNPESFTNDKGVTLLEAGVTRLTFGLQSLNDRELSLLGRVHSSERCHTILSDHVLSRFTSIGVDIMYGLPGQTMRTLEQTLAAVFDSPYVKHISAYELTVADNTPFGRHRSILPLPSEGETAVMTGSLWELLEKGGFCQYEVSNFAKPGHACRHNQAYWDHKPYLGLGCAAHSYLHEKRWANVRDVNRYIRMVSNGLFPREFIETIDKKKLAMEIVFLGLRKVQGINEAFFQESCGIAFADFIQKDSIGQFVNRGLLEYEKPFWKPTRKGLLMADAIAREIL